MESLTYERSMKTDFYKVLLINYGKHYYNTKKSQRKALWVPKTRNCDRKKCKRLQLHLCELWSHSEAYQREAERLQTLGLS